MNVDCRCIQMFTHFDVFLALQMSLFVGLAVKIIMWQTTILISLQLGKFLHYRADTTGDKRQRNANY